MRTVRFPSSPYRPQSKLVVCTPVPNIPHTSGLWPGPEITHQQFNPAQTSISWGRLCNKHDSMPPSGLFWVWGKLHESQARNQACELGAVLPIFEVGDKVFSANLAADPGPGFLLTLAVRRSPTNLPDDLMCCTKSTIMSILAKSMVYQVRSYIHLSGMSTCHVCLKFYYVYIFVCSCYGSVCYGWTPTCLLSGSQFIKSSSGYYSAATPPPGPREN